MNFLRHETISSLLRKVCCLVQIWFSLLSLLSSLLLLLAWISVMSLLLLFLRLLTVQYQCVVFLHLKKMNITTINAFHLTLQLVPSYLKESFNGTPYGKRLSQTKGEKINFYIILNGLLDNSEINWTSLAELNERSECNSSERVRFISNCHEGHSIFTSYWMAFWTIRK